MAGITCSYERVFHSAKDIRALGLEQANDNEVGSGKPGISLKT